MWHRGESCEESTLRFRTTRYLWCMCMTWDSAAAWLSCSPLKVQQKPPQVNRARGTSWVFCMYFPSLGTAAGTTCASSSPTHEPGSLPCFLPSLLLLLPGGRATVRSCCLHRRGCAPSSPPIRGVEGDRTRSPPLWSAITRRKKKRKKEKKNHERVSSVAQMRTNQKCGVMCVEQRRTPAGAVTDAVWGQVGIPAGADGASLSKNHAYGFSQRYALDVKRLEDSAQWAGRRIWFYFFPSVNQHMHSIITIN